MTDCDLIFFEVTSGDRAFSRVGGIFVTVAG